MKKTNKFFIFILSFIFLINFGISFALALEIQYPTFGGALPTITPQSQFPTYVQYYFKLSTAIAGFIALLSLAIASFQYVASAGDSGMITSARDRIKGALIGVILLFSSFIIMGTINPVLTTPTQNALPDTYGVFYSKGSDLKPGPGVPGSDPDTTIKTTEGYTQLIYKCANPTSDPTLLVWKYPTKQMQGTTGVVVARVTCNSPTTTLSGTLSFTTAYEAPGVYYFTESGCQGWSPGVITSDQSMGDDRIRKKVKSLRIVNDLATGVHYGIMFSNNIDYTKGGYCSDPLIIDTAEECKDISSIIGNRPDFSSARVFVWNEDPVTSGDGVAFYSNPFDDSRDAKSGYVIIKDSQINTTTHLWKGDAGTDEMKFDYTDVDATDEKKESCKFFKDCPGSIEIKNDYLTILQTDIGPSLYCQSFDQDVKNLGTEEYVNVSGIKIKNVIVIPIKR